ncbi:hypothetical protein GCM10023317_40600 [Actinopolymorpha pittospori]|uniref:Uncharacterized protein n=1 Tax=Actinopolymorpha pittospori TaxID=648752 RepID=A0A927MV93_9ACTN|nr:hypothetical protein [Actinopolymorpha pittospori]
MHHLPDREGPYEQEKDAGETFASVCGGDTDDHAGDGASENDVADRDRRPPVPDDVARYHEQGFLALPSLISAEEVARMRAI